MKNYARFEWDERKNKMNLEKHGISFETATKIFQHPMLSWQDTRHDYGEDRTITIGTTGQIKIIVVVHTDRNGRIRIISARPASRDERALYNEEIQ